MDQNGVRHYSDRPASPSAHLLKLGAPAPGSAAARPVLAASSPPASTAQAAVPATQKNRASDRAARCAKLRAEVKRLEPARRVKIDKDGKSRYLSGDDLAAFKKELAKKMHAACAPTP